MEPCSPEVALVLDGEFGDRLDALASTGAVWIAGSATNRAVAERLWRVDRPYGITAFRYDPLISGSEACAEILPVIDEHQGPASCNPPYRRLVVYGARPNAGVRAALAAIDFDLEGLTADGFTAVARGAA